jgi:hypothetical protein
MAELLQYSKTRSELVGLHSSGVRAARTWVTLISVVKVSSYLLKLPSQAKPWIYSTNQQIKPRERFVLR